MRFLYIIILTLITIQGWAGRKAAEKFFTNDVLPLESVPASALGYSLNEAGKVNSKTSPQTLTENQRKEVRYMASLDRKSSSPKRTLGQRRVGFDFGLHHLGSHISGPEMDSSAGWGGRLTLNSSVGKRSFQSRFIATYGENGVGGQTQRVLGLGRQWTWSPFRDSPLYGGILILGDHRFGNSRLSMDWGGQVAGNLGLCLRAKRADFSLELSRNSRLSVITGQIEHFWTMYSGLSIAY